jgi:hypothetical protein
MDAVDENGDGDAEADDDDDDDETARAVTHPINAGIPERLQTELTKTALALLPQKTSDTLKMQKQKLKEKNQDQDLKQD